MTRFQKLCSSCRHAWRRGSKPGRYAVVAALVLSLGGTSLALAGGERKTLFGDTRNGTYAKETKIISSSASYGTRQSNVRLGDGGGAIYGCRSAAGNEPCLRADNLRNGRAFHFVVRGGGTEGGLIEVGGSAPNASAVPFRTNAAGRVENLNADRLDGRDAADIGASWAVVSATGALSRDDGATSASNTGAGQYDVVFDRAVTGCAYAATIGDAGAGAPPSGITGVSQLAGNANGVRVVTRDDAGTPRNLPFHLTVNC